MESKNETLEYETTLAYHRKMAKFCRECGQKANQIEDFIYYDACTCTECSINWYVSKDFDRDQIEARKAHFEGRVVKLMELIKSAFEKEYYDLAEENADFMRLSLAELKKMNRALSDHR